MPKNDGFGNHKRGRGNRIFKDKAFRKEFFKWLKIGATIRDACHKMRVRYIIWVKECDRDDAFKRACDKYQIDAKLHHIQRVYDAENKWQASAWFLERRYREEYAVNLPEGATDEKRAIKVRRIVRAKSPGVKEPVIRLSERRKPSAKPSENNN